ncbi:MAG: replicative DNA helicase [Caldisericia bacterium]|nr:replicative DNA helicase [Caldisericia bacterium]
MEEILGRVPPHNIEAEQATLGSILIDNDAIVKVIDFLEPEHFYRTSHQLIYKAMKELYEKSEPIDLLTVSEHLKKKGELEEAGGFSYLATLTNITPTALNVEKYAKIVEEKSILREIIKAGIEIIDLAFNSQEDVGDTLDKAQEILFNVAKRRLSAPFYPLKDLLKESFDRIESLYKRKEGITGIPSGFPKLDKITGGFHKNDLIVLAARPSVGKTSFSLNVATNVATKFNLPVAIFSLEMSKEQIVERILEYTAEVNFHKLRTGIFSDEDWKKLGRAYGPLYDAPIYIDDSSDISVLEIRTKARRLKSKENLGMIVVDYLQLMHLRRKVENRVQEISEITRSLKKLAREVGVPVLVISQLSRAIEKREDKRPMLSDLRESGSIEQDADVVMFLSVKDEDKTKDTNIVDLIVAKNRNGPLGKIKLKFLKQFAKFLEMEYRFEEEGEEEPFV